MASITDFLNSDDAALGLGLLAASGPTTDPNQTGLGRVLAAGSQFANAQRRANAELAIKEGEARRKAMIENLGIQLLTGGGGVPSPTTPGGGAQPGVSAAPGPQPGTTPMIGPGAGPALGGANQQAVGADLLFNSGKGVGGMIADRSKPNWVNVGGNLINTNDPAFRGGVQRQIVTGRDGQVYEVSETPEGRVVTRVDPSSLAAFQQFQDISNVSRATTTPGRETILPGGRMGGQSQAQEIGLAPAPGAALAPRPMIGPGAGPTNAAERAMAVSVAQPNPDPVMAARRELAAIQRELPNVTDQASRDMLNEQARELQRVIGTAGAGIQTATPAALIGPGAGPAAPAPLPVQSSVIAGGGTAFSPTEQAQFAAQQKAAESAAGQTGTILKEAQDAANSAVQTVGSANRLRSVLANGAAFTGKAAGAKLTVSQWADALGITGKDAADKAAQTRAAIQDLAKLTLEGRQQMRGQGAITEGESRLAQQAISGDIDFSPAELKVLADAADRSARFKYKVASEQLGAAAQGNPALAAQAPMFRPQPLPDPFTPASKSAAPASTAIPSGWTVRQK